MQRILLLACLIVALQAETVGYRNDGNGHFPAVTAPPLTWDLAQGQGVAWKVPMPGGANGGAIVVGPLALTVAEPDLLVAVEATTGKEAWRAVVNPVLGKDAAVQALWAEAWAAVVEKRKFPFNGVPSEVKARFESFFGKSGGRAVKELGIRAPGDFGYAQATPASDGQTVFVRFGSGAVGAVGLDGRIRWTSVLPGSTGGESCLLVENLVVVLERSSKELVAVALDASTGMEAWRTPGLRNPHDGFQGGGPNLARIGGQAMIVCHGGEILRATDGKLLGKAECSGNSRVSTPIIVGDVVYFANQPDHGKGASGLESFRLAVAGDVVTATRLWVSAVTGHETMTSPLWTGRHAALAYCKPPMLWLFDPATGAPANPDAPMRFDLRMGMHAPSPSPCLVGGRYVYVGDERGTTTVLEMTTGPGFKPAGGGALGNMGGPLFFAGSRMYARTHAELICIGK